MSENRLAVRARYALRHSRFAQIGLILGFWCLGEALVRATGLPVPGGIVGLIGVLALLLSGVMGASSLRRGADWFLAEMLLFFVPAVLSVIDHREFFGLLGIKVFAVILASTVAVMGVTAITVDLCYRWRMRHDAADPRA